jgi:hypothetical protein
MVAPQLQLLVERDHRLEQREQLGVLSGLRVDARQLPRARLARRIAAARGQREAAAAQQVERHVRQARLLEPAPEPRLRVGVGLARGHEARLLQPEAELDLAKLRGLEAAGGLEVLAEEEEVERRHRLEHVDLLHQDLEDLDHAQQPARRTSTSPSPSRRSRAVASSISCRTSLNHSS